MKSKHALQLFFSLIMLFTLFGGIQPAQASDHLANRTDVAIITHDLSYWNATYIGSVDAVTYERWQFAFTEPHTFVVTAAPVASNLIPLIRLLDANGNELAHSTGSLASSQPVGSYFVQIQPQTGSGFYILTLRDAAQVQPSVSTVVNPTTINVGANATATVNLNNIPSTGYTSAEFTCTYNASLGQVSNIAVGGLFGTDPVVAVNGPQNGSFIIAIAGSNGNKAITSGTAFTFNVKGLQAGQIVITCTSRISKGDNVLSSILSSPASLVVQGNTPTSTSTRTSTPISALTSTATSLPTSTRTASPTFTQASNVTASPTSTLTVSPTFTQASNVTVSPTVTSLPSFTPLATFTRTVTATITTTATTTATATPTVTSLPSFTPLPTFTQTATVTPGPSLTSTPSATGILTGKVLASRPVTVGLYNAGNTLVTSVTTNTDGSFSLTAPIGTYSVLASASGFLSAQASTTLTSGATATLPTVSLLAGDIDNNKVIDQFDAMTIGMNYNASSPSAADLNNDGTINILDLELLARNYHKTGPTAWQ